MSGETTDFFVILPFFWENNFRCVVVLAAEERFLSPLNAGASGISTGDLTLLDWFPLVGSPPHVDASQVQTSEKNPLHSQRAGPDLPAVLLCVMAVQAVSGRATLTAAVATGAAVAVG